MPDLRRLAPQASLLLAFAVPCGAAGPMRTGMVEAELRAWSIERTGVGGRVEQRSVVGVALAAFVTDNIALGGEFGAFPGAAPGDSFLLDGRARLYWWPLSRFTPWLEARGGGAFGLPAGNALRWGAGAGLRWIPPVAGGHLALDLQLTGFERWKQDWPAEYVDEDQPSARVEWGAVHSPWKLPRRGFLGRASSPLSWPVLEVALLF